MSSLLERVDCALSWAVQVLGEAGCDTPRLDAEVLLAHVTGRGRAYLLAHPEARLEPAQAARFAGLVARRRQHCPVAYLTGRREFRSLDFTVGPGVLVPRPETELLVDVAIGLIDRGRGRGRDRWVIADVATGSGAVAIALAVSLGGSVRVHATDISPAALGYAARNVALHGLFDQVELHQGDLLEALPSAVRLDGIVANLPYVAAGGWDDLPLDVRRWEPRESLIGGPDGLELYRRLAAQMPARLSADGFVALEVGAGQASEVAGVLRSTGRFGAVEVHADLGGIVRVVAGIPAPTQDKNTGQNVGSG